MASEGLLCTFYILSEPGGKAVWKSEVIRTHGFAAVVLNAAIIKAALKDISDYPAIAEQETCDNAPSDGDAERRGEDRLTDHSTTGRLDLHAFPADARGMGTSGANPIDLCCRMARFRCLMAAPPTAVHVWRHRQ